MSWAQYCVEILFSGCDAKSFYPFSLRLLPKYALRREKMSGVEEGFHKKRLLNPVPLRKKSEDAVFPVPGGIFRHPPEDFIQDRPHLRTGR